MRTKSKKSESEESKTKLQQEATDKIEKVIETLGLVLDELKQFKVKKKVTKETFKNVDWTIHSALEKVPSLNQYCAHFLQNPQFFLKNKILASASVLKSVIFMKLWAHLLSL